MTPEQETALAEIRKTVAAGSTTKYVTRPLLVILEITAYSISVILLVICMWYYSKMNSILGIFDSASNIEKFFRDNEFTKPGFFDRLQYTLFIVSIVPSLFSLLIGRLLTSLRKKTNKMLKVGKLLNNFNEAF